MIWKRVFLASLLAIGPLWAQNDVREAVEQLKFLASDELRGRDNYEPEIDIAAEFIADQFRRLGLDPGGEDGFFQSFDLPERTLVNYSRLTVHRGGRTLHSALDSFQVLGYGESNLVRSTAVFAGYGITAPRAGFDDYASIDVEGKIVVLLENEPPAFALRRLGSDAGPSPYSSLYAKVDNARRHGAAAVVLVPDQLNRRRGHLFREDDEWRAPERLGLPVLRVGTDWARSFYALFSDQRLYFRVGDGFHQAQRWINDRLIPISFEIDDLELEIDLEVGETTREARNVMAYLPGLSEEIIVIGAHYDHVGFGDPRFDPQRLGEIHNGADDNASGIVGLLTLARRISQGPAPNRGVLFVAFAAEELGLIGSRHFVEHNPYDANQLRAMINLDMIGRSQGELFIYGAGTAREFADILKSAGNRFDLTLSIAQTPQAPSDHMPFSESGLPVLFFSSGKHAQYHLPEDDWERIDVPRMMQIIDLVGYAFDRIDRLAEGPSFVDLRPTDPRDGSRGPVLGMRPDRSLRRDGVAVKSFPAQSSAQAAGLLPGDLIIGLESLRISDYGDLRAELLKHSPGEVVELMAVRDGEVLVFPVVLDPPSR